MSTDWRDYEPLPPAPAAKTSWTTTGAEQSWLQYQALGGDFEAWLKGRLAAVEAERDAMRPVVNAVKPWRRRLDTLTTEHVGTWRETLDLVLAMDAYDAEVDNWRRARAAGAGGDGP